MRFPNVQHFRRSQSLRYVFTLLFATAGTLDWIGDVTAAELPIGQTSCRSTSGTYYLPKTLLRIQIGRQGGGTGSGVTIASTIGPDNRYLFCLDFLSKLSPEIERTADGLLIRVGGATSGDQVISVIRDRPRRTLDGMPAARGLVSSNDDQTRNLDLLFDPFDLQETTMVNGALRQYGCCIVIERHSFGPAQTAGQYCENPVEFSRRGAARRGDDDAAVRKAAQRAIIYRPRQPFHVSVYAKDTSSSGIWRLLRTKTMTFENIAPFVSLRIDPQLFAKRALTLTFDRGVLTDVQAGKSEQALGTVQIPLEVVKGLGKLPSEVLQIQLDEGSVSGQLLEAEKALIDAQRQYLEFLSGPNRPHPK